jgi:type III restriction enzyme
LDEKQMSIEIRKTPNVCGGDACLRDTRITVAILVSFRNLGETDAQILKIFPSLTQSDLDAAWRYYEKNREEIDESHAAHQIDEPITAETDK